MSARKQATPRKPRAKVMLVLFACLCPGALLAQTEDPFAIRVESNLVQVHVEVVSKTASRKVSPQFWRCYGALQDEFRSLLPSQPYLQGDCSDWMIRGLSPADFRLDEDGVEQKIQTVTVEPGSEITTRDNLGDHEEWSDTPQGKWSSVDFPLWYPPNQTIHYYSVGYVPAKLAEGKCHRITVTVTRPDAMVFAPNEYCYVPHPANDPLLGTNFGNQLQADLDSDSKSKIPLLLQANFQYADLHRARVDVVVEFSWEHLKHGCTSSGDLPANIGLLGTVYSAQHTVWSRFSDFYGGTGPHAGVGSEITCDFDAKARLPSRYETQLDLPPGQYNLHVLLSDGKKFGRANVPISIDDYDGKQLALSSVIPFKRYRNASAAAEEAKYVNLAPDYVPLVSKGQQITPTANPAFARKTVIPVYFEVYEPFLADQPAITVRAHARIVSVKSGEIRNFNWFDAAEFRRPGSTTFAIAKEFDSTGLPKGEYRLEVQASDSAGHTTPWRAAAFTLR